MIGDSGRNRNGMDSAEKLLHHSSAAARSACVARGGGGVSAEGECASERASMERYDLVFRDRVTKGRGGGGGDGRSQKMLILSTHHEDLSVLSR